MTKITFWRVTESSKGHVRVSPRARVGQKGSSHAQVLHHTREGQFKMFEDCSGAIWSFARVKWGREMRARVVTHARVWESHPYARHTSHTRTN